MCVRFVSAALTVVALTAAPVLLSASDKAVPANNGKVVQRTTVEKASSTPFATLKGIKAVPMAAKELDAVKGQHVHFWNPGAPFPGEPHIAGGNNTDHWKNLYGDGFVANSYHGLCVAAANGSAIFINPHGGCG
jgi:hypothetical protein